MPCQASGRDWLCGGAAGDAVGAPRLRSLALAQQNVVGLLELLKGNAGLLGRQLRGVGMQGLGLATKGLSQGFSVDPGAHAKPFVMAGAGFGHWGRPVLHPKKSCWCSHGRHRA